MSSAFNTMPLQKEKTNKRPTLGQRIAGRVPKQPDPGTPTSRGNAANWNKPGGGYDQWKAGDADREKAMPVGTIIPRKKPDDEDEE